MTNLQHFVSKEKNVHQLIYSMMNEDCNTCPAHSFCLKDGRRAEPKWDDCGDAFVAWAMQEKKTRRKKDAEPRPCLETTNT